MSGSVRPAGAGPGRAGRRAGRRRRRHRAPAQPAAVPSGVHPKSELSLLARTGDAQVGHLLAGTYTKGDRRVSRGSVCPDRSGDGNRTEAGWCHALDPTLPQPPRHRTPRVCGGGLAPGPGAADRRRRRPGRPVPDRLRAGAGDPSRLESRQRRPRPGRHRAGGVLRRDPDPLRGAPPAGGHPVSTPGLGGADRGPLGGDDRVRGAGRAHRTPERGPRRRRRQRRQPHLHHHPLPPGNRRRRRADRVRLGSGAQGLAAGPRAGRPGC